MTKTEILTAALTQRDQEVLEYQINIDNFALAIDHIANMPAEEQAELAEYTERLREMLASNRLEQKKTRVIRDVIAQQLGV